MANFFFFQQSTVVVVRSTLSWRTTERVWPVQGEVLWSLYSQIITTKWVRGVREQESAERVWPVQGEVLWSLHSQIITTKWVRGVREQRPRPKKSPGRGFGRQRTRQTFSCWDLWSEIKTVSFGLERFASSDYDIFFYTGFQNYIASIAYWNFVKPCSETVLSWNRARAKKRKTGKKEILLTLRFQTIERQLSGKSTAWIIRAWPGKQIWCLCKYCLWCGCHLGKLSLHITMDIACVAFKRKDKEHLLNSFKGKYENVQGILDCTELKCELLKDYQRSCLWPVHNLTNVLRLWV